ncbi:MAG: bifunctional pyr operon transcriptional regulator/uracil phosphoribosyltransferase PyrR [Deltaproteobacteria bacterium]|nr:bifunctional pyr operon transcriptional regulator/uracil phosphoribosyltransferase PyrR [Deltaproteobacteria bacterium]
MILEAAGIRRATRRMAHEILERNPAPESIALVAIVRGGVPVADMLAQALSEIAGRDVPQGALDVTLYRDDVIGHGMRPIPHKTRMPFSVTGKRVVLVEDVVFTGRTVRAAMDAVIDFGRPEAIQVATLVDRGHRELPIRVDFVGKNIPTARAEKVVLRQAASGEYEVVVV